ncbi:MULTISPECIES: LacI family DNA-binding transcriptional regulator [unclassified Luteibacter]|uniref:LacI family DNA-binding transcriptional regulator n=1 Tax=Luteibacter sp. PvP019 TaxID=3156436 RepID=UPI00339785A2
MPPKKSTPKKTAPAKARQKMQMADIARLSGVSKSTVSRALAGSALISEETRERVREVASRFKYTINRMAVELRSGTNRTIAVVVPYEDHCRQTFADPFFHAMIGSLADALTERGLEMLLTRVPADHIDSIAAIVDGGRAAGVILIGQWRQHEALNELAARSVPFVVWGAHLPGQQYCSIGGDNRLGGRLAGEHLVAKGRTQAIFLGDRELPEVALRLKGFTEALKAGGASLGARRIKATSFLPDSGREVMQAVMKEGHAIDAIFASSDLLAMTAVGVLHEHGISVPGDVSVVGYDDVGISAHFNPPLTTVRQPIHAGGVALVDALTRLIAGEAVADEPMLPTELVARASS